MCEPTTIMATIAATQAAVSAGGAVAEHIATNNAAGQNKKSALRSLSQNYSALNERESQEQGATSATLLDVERQTRSSMAMASVSAGESGVAGASVSALLGDIDRQGAEAKVREQTNLKNTLSQLEQEKAGARANAQSRINGAPRASLIGTGLRIGGTGLDYAAGVYNRRVKANDSKIA